jgi:hypothetical protein
VKNTCFYGVVLAQIMGEWIQSLPSSSQSKSNMNLAFWPKNNSNTKSVWSEEEATTSRIQSEKNKCANLWTSWSLTRPGMQNKVYGLCSSSIVVHMNYPLEGRVLVLLLVRCQSAWFISLLLCELDGNNFEFCLLLWKQSSRNLEASVHNGSPLAHRGREI